MGWLILALMVVGVLGFVALHLRARAEAEALQRDSQHLRLQLTKLADLQERYRKQHGSYTANLIDLRGLDSTVPVEQLMDRFELEAWVGTGGGSYTLRATLARGLVVSRFFIFRPHRGPVTFSCSGPAEFGCEHGRWSADPKTNNTPDNPSGASRFG